MKRSIIQLFTLVILFAMSIQVDAQIKVAEDSAKSNKSKIQLFRNFSFTAFKKAKNSTSKSIHKALKDFSGNQTYLYGGIGFNKQNVNETGFTSPFNYRLVDINDNSYKAGFNAGFRFDGLYKQKHKYSITVGLNKIASGVKYINAKRLDPFIGEFVNYKADNQLVTFHFAANYKYLLPIADSIKYKFYLVGGPSIDYRLSKQTLDNQVNDNYRNVYLGASLGVEFDNNSYYTLYLHYNRNLNSLTKSPIKSNLNTFNFGVLLKLKDLF